MTREEAIAFLETVVEMAIKSLEQERVLDKIRAEIEQEPYVSKMEVLEIIDKYKGRK